MSQENVERVLRLYPASDVDFSSLVRDDARWAAVDSQLAYLLHPEFEVMLDGGLSAEPFAGPGAIRAGLLDWIKPWASYRAEVDRAIDCGDRVLVIYESIGRLEGSTAEVKLSAAEVWTFRDGKVVRWEIFPDRSDAFKAVGLEE